MFANARPDGPLGLGPSCGAARWGEDRRSEPRLAAQQNN